MGGERGRVPGISRGKEVIWNDKAPVTVDPSWLARRDQRGVHASTQTLDMSIESFIMKSCSMNGRMTIGRTETDARSR